MEPVAPELGNRHFVLEKDFPPSQMSDSSPVERYPICYLITGVSGSGKSTVGKLLADKLQCRFYDGDDFHPSSNIQKMRRGKALSDEDRVPWLQRLAQLIEEHVQQSELCVVACSCLKQKYRRILYGSTKDGSYQNSIYTVLLQPSKEELVRRVEQRSKHGSHFMPASLLDSQLETLEIDPNSHVFGGSPPEAIVAEILAERRLLTNS